MDLGQDRLRRPLITGAGGFLGSHMARELAALPDTQEIYCVDLPGNARIKELQKISKITCISADLNDTGVYGDLPTDVTSVFAMAALNGTSRFYTQPFSVFRGSLLPTINIVMKYANIAPIVYTSSSEVYASTVTKFQGDVPTSELISPSVEDIHNPRWSYSVAKLGGEVAINSAAIELKAITAIVRYHNVYGPNMGFDHFIPDFIERAKKGVYEITGADETRAFMYISDAIQGTIAALLTADENAEVYHLGSREEMRILTAAETILSMMKIDGAVVRCLPSRPGSVKRRVADPSKAQLKLNWQTKISFEDGVSEYLANNWD